MGLEERVQLYKQIEQVRNRPLICYFTSARHNAQGKMGADVIPEFIDQIQKLPLDVKEIDLLIESTGGDALVSWRIMSLLRERMVKISVLIPYCAFSAATLLSLGADEIVMGEYGCLGPIDPQIMAKKKDGTIQAFAYNDIAAYLEFVREEAKLTEQDHLEKAFEKLSEQVDPSTLGGARRASALSLTLAERLLQTHMSGAEDKIRASDIAKKLNESFFSHGHAVGRNEAKTIGLNIINANSEIEKLIWAVHEDFEKDLKLREPFDPLGTFLSHPGAADFIQNPPTVQIPAPFNQLAANLYQQYFTKQMQNKGPDVHVELDHALVESIRHASCFHTKLKIVCMRTPDLGYKANVVQLNSGWENRPLPI